MFRVEKKPRGDYVMGTQGLVYMKPFEGLFFFRVHISNSFSYEVEKPW